LDAERDAAAALQGARNSRGVALAAFTAYSLRFSAPVGSPLHPFLNSERLPSGSNNVTYLMKGGRLYR
jgi:hypothetical protein